MWISCLPLWTNTSKNSKQRNIIQNRLTHSVTGTNLYAMGDTLSRMSIEMSSTNRKFALRDKGDLIVILSRSKFAKKIIFVGNKMNTLDLLLNILMKKCSWSSYMDQVLDTITLNNSNTNKEILSQSILQNKYLF